MSTKEKYEVIKDYLRKKFPDSTIEQKDDFNRGADSFKVHLADCTLLLKVGREFLEDNNIAEIISIFNPWALAQILEKNPEFLVLVTQRGVEAFWSGTYPQPIIPPDSAR
jgi:hypothetical protein